MNRKPEIFVEPASVSDRELLLDMNRQLMEDEKYDRVPAEEVLSRRWDEFLSLDRFGVYLFRTADSRVAGYAVVHLDEEPRYLRHFFIRREERRHGYGTAAFHALLETLDVRRMDLDVMSWNERGRGFWKSLGFTERCRMMAYDRETSGS